MLPVRRKLVIIAIVAVGAIAVFYAAAIVIPAWHARYCATILLNGIRALRPGITTELQARTQLKSLSRYENPDSEQHGEAKSEEVSYRFYNCAEWVGKLVSPLPISWAQHLTLPFTSFEATISYRDSLVGEVHIVEMQTDIPGMPHPNAASTTILASRLGQQLGFVPPPESEFTGYQTYSRSTGRAGADGYLTSFSCCHERWIMLDERATPTQLADALNFQLHCLTSWHRCKDDHQILP